MEQRFSTRTRTRGLAAVAAAAVAGRAGLVLAQDQTIQSTRLGEMPSGGGARPGPSSGFANAPRTRTGVIPVSISIAKADVDASIEIIEIVDGVMQDPTGPWVVSWYKETARLGELGNSVMAGHVDYWDVGPAVFWNIRDLVSSDKIDVTGEDGKIYTYAVDWVESFVNSTAPIQDIVGPTPRPALTLITCGGSFDYTTGQYLERTVARATIVE
jgi:sortase (surface protein transpeptidase)